MNALRELIVPLKQNVPLPVLSKNYLVNNELSKYLENLSRVQKIDDLDKILSWSEENEKDLQDQLLIKSAANEDVNKAKQSLAEQKIKKLEVVESYLEKVNQLFTPDKVENYLAIRLMLSSSFRLRLNGRRLSIQ